MQDTGYDACVGFRRFSIVPQTVRWITFRQEWVFISDTIEAVYRSPNSHPSALVDRLAIRMGSGLTPSGSRGNSFSEDDIYQKVPLQFFSLANGKDNRSNSIWSTGLSPIKTTDHWTEPLSEYFGVDSIFEPSECDDVRAELCIEWACRFGSM